MPDNVDRDFDRRFRPPVLEPVDGVPVLGPAHTRPIVRRNPVPMVGDRSLQHLDGSRSALVVMDWAEHASRMPSISGPSSTVASSSTVTPRASGATGSSLIVLSFLVSRPSTSHRLPIMSAGSGSWPPSA